MTTTVKFRINGKQQRNVTELDWKADTLGVSNLRTYSLAAERGAGEEPVLETLQDGDVVEVELENGLRFWTSPKALRDEVFAELGVKRGADEVFEIPAQIPGVGAERGLGSLVIKVLRFFTPVIETVAAKELARKVEKGGLEGGKGETRLYRCVTKNGDLTLEAVAAGQIPTDKTALLLLHGTGSSTRGSFGELWNDKGSDWARRDSWLKLLGAYDTVLALEHCTLTENPVQNLLILLDSLPAGLTLHVMSHSRGGMVGELLCRGSAAEGQAPFSDTELACFLKADPNKLRGDLDKLNQALKDKRVRVERFVRTACPARGTTLASGRLDIYFSALRALLGLVPGVVGGVLDGLAELAAGVAGKRTDPSVLPGIEAMVPGSPLVKLLNNPTAKVQGRLRVISGDIEGGTLGSTFLTLLADPLFLSKHDLVVNTDSMYAGAQRSDGAAYVFYQGPEISHFRYFTNRPSVEKLEAALTAKDPGSDGFKPYEIATPVEPDITRGAAEARPRHTVFLLPGIMGSHLEIRENRVWLDFAELALGGMGRLRLNQMGVQEEALVGGTYNDMINALSGAYNVVPFPYDWRISVKQTAERLAAAIEAKLDELEKSVAGGLPVSLVAHSMGGMVVRALIRFHESTWKRLCSHKEARVIMLGTPTRGSHAMAMVLTGQDGLMRRLAMLDFQHDLAELLAIVGEYPGVAELLPEELLDPAKWRELRNGAENVAWTPPADAILEAAKKTRDEIDGVALDGERVYYIAGKAEATPCAVSVAVGEDGKPLVQFEATACGDGRVTWENGIPDKVRAWYAEARHGDLCKAEKCCAAVGDLLRNGDTGQLAKVAPLSRGAQDNFAMPIERSVLHPDYEELLAAALCSTPNRVQAGAVSKIRVEVVHGSLEFASYPILVGHYRGDTLVSAEADLDRHLGGQLRDAHQLGLYPGEANTAQIFHNDKTQPKGAIVVGLGEVGELAPGILESAVSRGIRSYAASLADCHVSAREPQRGISVLLVGTNGAGVSVATAVAAILRGIDKALQNLEKHHLGDRLALEEIELVEIYQDRAIQAAHALQDAARDDTLAQRFDLSGAAQVQCRRGAKRRAFCEDTPDWWQRLVIREDECGELSFGVISDRARTENHTQIIQRKLVDKLIEDALADPTPGNAAAATLFQMLTPNELKQYAPDQRSLVLMLNEATARYPWELMVENTTVGKGGGRDPASVRGGMVRQLDTTHYREKVMHATEKTALIIGHPNLPKGKFPPLPGAAKEAREVQKRLSDYNYDVNPVIERDAATIMEELFRREYLILHLSGHGVYREQTEFEQKPQCREKRPWISGMVIGDDLFLTPAEIRQMTTVPELAFINCCHLGKIDDENPDFRSPNLPALAANLGAELINMGVRAVVAAGWAVDDQAAQLFAKVFYEAMLGGKDFGTAVREARKSAYLAYPHNNTWGAYQCYGDPSYALGNDGGHAESGNRDYRFVHPEEAIVVLDNIAGEAAILQECEIDFCRKEVRAVHDTLPPAWLEQARILAALGRAWGELGEFAEAVDCYEKASIAESGETPLAAIEQLCNLRARNAVARYAQDGGDAAQRLKEALGELEQAEKEANAVLTIGPTVERHIMLGSVHKRRALVLAQHLRNSPGSGKESKKHLKDALEEMRKAYDSADQLHRTNNRQAIYPYPLLYAAASRILLAMLAKQSHLDIDQLQGELQKAREAGQTRDRENPCYWDAIAGTEAELLETLAAGTRSQPDKPADTGWVESVAQKYRTAQERDGSPRERRSVQEHLDFLATIADVAGRTEAAASLRTLKGKIA